MRTTLIVLSVIALAIHSSSYSAAAGRWVDGGELEVVGIHSAMLPNGRVLVFGYKDGHHFVDEQGRYQLWNPDTRRPVAPSTVIDGWNPFCSGHCFLGDGRLFVAGGFKFGDPARSSSADKVSTARSNADGTVTWSRDYGKMEDLRWYPTVATLGNGDCLIIGGSAPFAADNWKDTNEDYEYFSLDNNYLVRHNESQRDLPRDDRFPYPAGDRRQKVADGKRLAGLYPLTHLLPNRPGDDAPNGLLFVVTESFLRLYNPTTNRILGRKVDVGGFRTWWTQGSSVLLPIDIDAQGRVPEAVRVMLVGGGTTGKNEPGAAAIGTADIYSYTIASRTLRRERTIRLNRARVMGDSILMPDGNVVVVGGAETGYANENRNRVRMAELIRIPANGAAPDVVDLADSSQLRGYHATSLLLPDGSVFVTGGNGNWHNGPVNEFKTVEVFEPPYLAAEERPVISTAPSSVAPGEQFVVSTTSPNIEPVVVLMRNGSRTHSVDTDQRMLRLQAAVSTAGTQTRLTVTLPTATSVAVPGPYMLFILRRGTTSPQPLVPSRARTLAVSQRAAQPEVMVSAVRFTIQTGGDDLRGGNDNAFGAVRIEEAGPRMRYVEFPLNNRASWGNHSTNAVTHRFSSPVRLRDMKGLRIRTTFGGGMGGDNWNIDRLIVDYESGGSWHTLSDGAGTPLVRLTGERKTWEKSL